MSAPTSRPRSSTVLPRSHTTGRSPARASVSAAKRPHGPAPTTTTRGASPAPSHATVPTDGASSPITTGSKGICRPGCALSRRATRESTRTSTTWSQRTTRASDAGEASPTTAVPFAPARRVPVCAPRAARAARPRGLRASRLLRTSRMCSSGNSSTPRRSATAARSASLGVSVCWPPSSSTDVPTPHNRHSTRERRGAGTRWWRLRTMPCGIKRLVEGLRGESTPTLPLRANGAAVFSPGIDMEMLIEVLVPMRHLLETMGTKAYALAAWSSSTAAA
mmetsp:Transcript_1465/g.3013  ORF Transcript_1465/g.3013 Transcript_1465/m.3013 type:complete len:278 (+) Transcript_1465:2033-2866(+)